MEMPGESRYPGALPPVLENFRRAFSPCPTDCPWVSEDEACANPVLNKQKTYKTLFDEIHKENLSVVSFTKYRVDLAKTLSIIKWE